jgi:hypothetical protein
VEPDAELTNMDKELDTVNKEKWRVDSVIQRISGNSPLCHVEIRIRFVHVVSVIPEMSSALVG